MEDLDCHKGRDFETLKRHRQWGLFCSFLLSFPSCLTPNPCPPHYFCPCWCLLVSSGAYARAVKAGACLPLHGFQQSGRGGLKLITLVTKTILGDGVFINILLL